MGECNGCSQAIKMRLPPHHLQILLISFTFSFLVTGIHIPVPSWPSPYWFLVPGSFCKSAFPQMQCCSGRTDACSVRILDTRCYCDSFCNRTGSSDCCPDYSTHCEGLQSDYNQPQRQIPWQYQVYEYEGPAPASLHASPVTEEKEQVSSPQYDPIQQCAYGRVSMKGTEFNECQFEGRLIKEGEALKKNCKICSCKVSQNKPGCMEVTCSSE